MKTFTRTRIKKHKTVWLYFGKKCYKHPKNFLIKSITTQTYTFVWFNNFNNWLKIVTFLHSTWTHKSVRPIFNHCTSLILNYVAFWNREFNLTGPKFSWDWRCLLLKRDHTMLWRYDAGSHSHAGQHQTTSTIEHWDVTAGFPPFFESHDFHENLSFRHV